MQYGGAGSVVGNAGGLGSRLSDNTYLDAAAAARSLFTGAAALLDVNNAVAGGLAVYTAPSVAAGPPRPSPRASPSPRTAPSP